jgi:hypothetical protein
VHVPHRVMGAEFGGLLQTGQGLFGAAKLRQC